MTECIQFLTHKNRLKAITKELSIGELTKVKDSLIQIIETRQAEEEKALSEAAEKKQQIAKAQAMIAEMGLSIEDMLGEIEVTDKSTKTKSSKRGPVLPKYRLNDAELGIVEWSGRGRTPKPIQAYLDKGNSIDELLIQD